MKKSTILLLLFVLLSPVYVFSGDPRLKLTFGQEYELPKGHMDLGFVGNTKEGFVQISHKYGKSLSFQRFSPQLKLTGEQTVDLKTMPKGYMVEDFIEWNGQNYWFYSIWDKPAKKEHLLVQKLNVKKGELTGNSTELIETDKVTGNLVATGFYKFQVANKYKISFSSDSTKMFVYVKYPHEFKNDAKSYEEFGLWVFDKNFKILWNKRIKMPYSEKKMQLKDVQCDLDGNYMFLAKVYNDDTRKDIVDNAPNFHFEILKFAKGADKPVVISFEFGDKYVAQLELLENKGQIVCCGFYGERDAKGKLRAIRGKVDGSFFLKINPETNKVEKVQKGFYPIPDEIYKEYVSEKTAKKIEKKEAKGEGPSENNLVLRHVIFGDDGSLMLLGEQYYYVVTTYTNGNHTYTRTTYYYLDIIAQYIDPAGNLAWTKKIPKRQIGGDNTFGLGFRVLPYNGANYLFFLDNIKNLNLPKDQAPAVHAAGWGGVLMGVRLNDKGTMEKFKVFDTREVKEKINILGADRIGANMLIDRVFVKKTSKICLMEVQ